MSAVKRAHGTVGREVVCDVCVSAVKRAHGTVGREVVWMFV